MFVSRRLRLGPSTRLSIGGIMIGCSGVPLGKGGRVFVVGHLFHILNSSIINNSK